MNPGSVLELYGGAAGLAVISFLPVYVMHRRGEPACVSASFGVVVLLLHALSLVNVFSGPLPGAHWDAETFHDTAVKLVESGAWPQISMGTKFYEYMLTATYKLFGTQLLVGQSLSVLAGAGALMIIDAIAVSLGVGDPRIRAGVILVAGLYPTFLYHNALTFREPFELLGLASGVFFVVKTLQAFRWKWVAGAVLSFLFMGLFHHVLLGICVLLICLFVLLLYIPKLGNARNHAVLAALIVLTTGLGYFAIMHIPITLENNYIKDIRKERGIIEAIVRYRDSIESREPRTSYDSSIDADTAAGIAGSGAVNYWNYLSRPWVSDLERPSDGVPFASAIGRMALLAGFAWLAFASGAFNRELAFCLGTYLVVTAVWSLGTTNYGQSFRHHALTDWLAVVMFAAVLSFATTGRRAVNEGPERLR